MTEIVELIAMTPLCERKLMLTDDEEQALDALTAG